MGGEGRFRVCDFFRLANKATGFRSNMSCLESKITCKKSVPCVLRIAYSVFRIATCIFRFVTKVANFSAALKPSIKRTELFRNEVQEAEMAEHLFSGA